MFLVFNVIYFLDEIVLLKTLLAELPPKPKKMKASEIVALNTPLAELPNASVKNALLTTHILVILL